MAYLKTLIRITQTEKRLQAGRTQFHPRQRQTPRRPCPFPLRQNSLRPQHTEFAGGQRYMSLGSGALDQGLIICQVVCNRTDTNVVISNVTRSTDVASLVSLCCAAQTQALQMADSPLLGALSHVYKKQFKNENKRRP